ncbi:MAG: large repetitive protein, partial [Acidobacteriota bacterium]|nr:large repetitive protein [Acidobacteriota bacterium]
MTRKFSFLPAFFLVLAVVFGIAVFLRVRAYQTADELPPGLSRPAETATHPDGVTAAAAPDPGQIVEIAPDGTTIAPTGTSDRDRSAAASAREQRYNELLRAAPPGAPVAPPETMFQKLVNPIANALGMTEKKPVAAAAPHPAAPSRPTAQQLQQQQQQRQQQQQQQETAKKAEETDQPPADEDSDTKPPQLVGIEFTPSQVKDGGETMLVLTVVDDLSGVRSVSGVIASPAGALQGFAGQREPETNRYVSRIQIPAEAAEGIWKINYVSLSDNAGNSIQLTAAQGNLPQTAAFQVRSSQSDSKGPTLRNVWLDKPAITAGEKTTIFVDAEDDKSGVTLASGVFVSPGKHARLGFGCRPGAEGSTTWECDFTPAANVECGLWQLEQIQLQDK